MSDTTKDMLSAAIVLALVAFPLAKLVTATTEIVRML